jgi:hypothetical protein
MFLNSIPESTMTLASEVLAVMQWAAMPVKLLVFHLAVAISLQEESSA